MLVGDAKTLALDPAKFRQVMQSKEVGERVATDQKRAAKLGVTVTPTVFFTVNRSPVRRLEATACTRRWRQLWPKSRLNPDARRQKSPKATSTSRLEVSTIVYALVALLALFGITDAPNLIVLDLTGQAELCGGSAGRALACARSDPGDRGGFALDAATRV